MLRSIPRALLLITLFSAAASASYAQTYELLRNFSVASGTVNALAQKGDTLFIGGDLTQVALPLSYGAVLHTPDGSPDLQADRPGDRVSASVADGQGGWYVSGPFTTYGEQPRSGIAHIGGNGRVDTWAPQADAAAVGGALVVSGNWIITGGASQVTALDASTGQNIGWTISTSGQVRAFAVRNGILYAAGDFTLFGGQARTHLAAVDITTGAVTSWSVSCNGNVNGLVATPTALVAAGGFSTMAGSNRNGLAALDYNSALCTTWNPNVQGGSVNAVVALGDTIYAGGGFASVGGNTRASLAAVRLSNGAVLPWSPGTNGYVNALSAANDTVFAVGQFQTAGGLPHEDVAAIIAGSGMVADWSAPAPDIMPLTAALNGQGRLFIGGYFMSMGGVPRSNLAAVRISTGAVLPWRHDVIGGPVNALCVVGDRLFIGGQFSTIGGATHHNLGAVDLSTDAIDPWGPEPGQVHALAVYGSRLYVGGSFALIDGQSRHGVASFDLPALTLTGWDPQIVPVNYGNAFSFHENLAFIGMGTGMAIADTATSLLMPWAPLVDYGSVDALMELGGTMYFGGSFATVNGATQPHSAACDPTTGAVNSWWLGGGYWVTSFATNGSTLFAGFTNLLDQEPYALAGFDPLTAAVTVPSEVFGLSDVQDLLLTDSVLIAGGGFQRVFGHPWHGLAAYRVHDLSTGVASLPAARAWQEAFAVWPDPYAGGPLHFALNDGDAQVPLRAELLDGDGRCVAQLPMGSMHGTFSGTEGLADGLYFMRVVRAKGVQVARLVVAR